MTVSHRSHSLQPKEQLNSNIFNTGGSRPKYLAPRFPFPPTSSAIPLDVGPLKYSLEEPSKAPAEIEFCAFLP